jgi:DNA-binding response OmpR family regulator
MRLLVVDHSGILPWIVEHAAGEGDEVEAVASLEDAERVIRERPPDAAVVSLTRAELPWGRFQHLCATQRPPVPVLWESCVHSGPRDAGIDPADGVALFLAKPLRPAVLHEALRELLARARRLH